MQSLLHSLLGVPRFLPRDADIGQFFCTLNAAGCRYVVLRWFETLPHIQPGEDIDILVHEDDADLLRSFLKPKSPAQRFLGARRTRCDVYSVTGRRGSTYRGLAYYPPPLARRILEGAILHPSGAKVPRTEEHFCSLAFHAIYHKGLISGIPSGEKDLPAASKPEHDYGGILRELADRLHLDVRIEMNALDEELGRQGWRPPIDLLHRFLPHDAWVKRRIAATQGNNPTQKGLSIFFLRERALDRPGELETVCDLLTEDGFNVLCAKRLSAEEKERVARGVRGANWGTGPWNVSGGLPAAAIAAMDVFPKAPSKYLLRKHPAVDNERVFESKFRIRDWHNQQLAPSQRSNVIHSSDNCVEAMHYLSLAMPESREQLLETADRLAKQTEAPGEVVRDLTRMGRRAVTEVIRDRAGKQVVRKRFRPGREMFFEREVAALRELGAICPKLVPPLLERGENYHITPYYSDRRWRLTRALDVPLPVFAIRQTFDAVKAFANNGFSAAGICPDHILVERGKTIKITRYDEMEDVRVGGRSCEEAGVDRKSFEQNWRRATALPYGSAMRDPIWLMHAKRVSVGHFIWAASLGGAGYRALIKRVRASIERRQRRGKR